MDHQYEVTVNLYLEDITKRNKYYDEHMDFYQFKDILPVGIDTSLKYTNYKGQSSSIKKRKYSLVSKFVFHSIKKSPHFLNNTCHW